MLPLPGLLGFDAPPVWFISLPLITWIIYTTDHYFDSRNSFKQQYHRHLFIANYFKYIIPLQVILMGFVVAFMIREFPPEVYLLGGIVIFVTACYFLIAHYQKKEGPRKDLLVAFVYPSGIYLLPFSYNLSYPLSLIMISLPYTVLFLLVFMNLKLNSYYEQGSSNKAIKKEITLIAFIALILILSGFFLLSYSIRLILGSYLLVLIGHLSLLFFNRNSLFLERYRKISEALFWLPGLIYFLV